MRNRNIALDTDLDGHLKDGRYSFAVMRFDVVGDTLAIFYAGQLGLSGDTFPITIIKKYSNGLEHYGTRLSQTIDPSVVIDVNDVPGPALIQGDCLATYSPETGRVDIPCLSIKGRNTIYSVGQQKHTDRLTFDVDENDVIRIQ